MAEPKQIEGDRIVELPMILEDGSVALYPVSVELAGVWLRAYERATKVIGKERMEEILNYLNP